MSDTGVPGELCTCLKLPSSTAVFTVEAWARESISASVSVLRRRSTEE